MNDLPITMLPSGCPDRCHRMGICMALADCAHANAQPTPPAMATVPSPAAPAPTTGQSRAHSLAETVTSITVGFIVSMLLQAVLLPWYGHPISLSDNFQITAIFTVASLLRSYGLRRLFNRLHRGGAS